MIFQFVYGKGSHGVRVYGYPSGTVTIDGVSKTLNSSGYVDVDLTNGSHTFVDGHIAGNTKTVTISGSCTVVVGLKASNIGSSSSPKTSNGVHNNSGGTNSGYNDTTVAIPAGNIVSLSHAKASGYVRSRQTHSGYTASGPGCYSGGSISVDYTTIASRSFPSSPDLSYGAFSDSRTSGWKSFSGEGIFTAHTSGNLNVRMTGSIKEDSGNASTYAYTDYYTSEVYIY